MKIVLSAIVLMAMSSMSVAVSLRTPSANQQIRTRICGDFGNRPEGDAPVRLRHRVMQSTGCMFRDVK